MKVHPQQFISYYPGTRRVPDGPGYPRQLYTDRSERDDVTGCRRVERYDGVEVERSLYVSTATLL